jgi:hypothetical protein
MDGGKHLIVAVQARPVKISQDLFGALSGALLLCVHLYLTGSWVKTLR